LLTIVIFCFPPWFWEIEVLLFVRESLEGDFCLIGPLAGDKAL